MLLEMVMYFRRKYVRLRFWFHFLWELTTYNLVDRKWSFRGTWCQIGSEVSEEHDAFTIRIDDCHENGSSMLLWNGGTYLPDHMASHPRRQYSAVYEYCVQQLSDMFCFKKFNAKKMLWNHCRDSVHMIGIFILLVIEVRDFVVFYHFHVGVHLLSVKFATQMAVLVCVLIQCLSPSANIWDKGAKIWTCMWPILDVTLIFIQLKLSLNSLISEKDISWS